MYICRRRVAGTSQGKSNVTANFGCVCIEVDTVWPGIVGKVIMVNGRGDGKDVECSVKKILAAELNPDD